MTSLKEALREVVVDWVIVTVSAQLARLAIESDTCLGGKQITVLSKAPEEGRVRFQMTTEDGMVIEHDMSAGEAHSFAAAVREAAMRAGRQTPGSAP